MKFNKPRLSSTKKYPIFWDIKPIWVIVDDYLNDIHTGDNHEAIKLKRTPNYDQSICTTLPTINKEAKNSNP